MTSHPISATTGGFAMRAVVVVVAVFLGLIVSALAWDLAVIASETGAGSADAYQVLRAVASDGHGFVRPGLVLIVVFVSTICTLVGMAIGSAASEAKEARDNQRVTPTQEATPDDHPNYT